MSQGLVTYIVLGSEERLKTLKLPVSNREEEYLFANFSNNVSCEKKLDRLVTNSCGNLIVFLPPSAFPNLKAKNALKKMNLLIDSKKKKEALKFLPKLNSELMKIAKTGIIKKQNASRNVSRISKKINSI